MAVPPCHPGLLEAAATVVRLLSSVPSLSLCFFVRRLFHRPCLKCLRARVRDSSLHACALADSRYKWDAVVARASGLQLYSVTASARAELAITGPSSSERLVSPVMQGRRRPALQGPRLCGLSGM